jgi:predicted alpha/beta-hydrolase family hydrolase
MPTSLLWNEPAGRATPGAPLVALSHGAGGPMDEPVLEAIAVGLAARRLRVVRFELPYMAARRADGRRRPPDRQPVLLDAWRAAVSELGGGAGLVIGGKSMGGRMASLVADELGVRGLVCLGYPFHPPRPRSGGLTRPERLRTAHLAALRTPALIVQGTRDPFGTPEEVASYALSPAIRVAWIEDGDHGFAPRRASGRTRAQNLEDAIAALAGFVAGLGGGAVRR